MYLIPYVIKAKISGIISLSHSIQYQGSRQFLGALAGMPFEGDNISKAMSVHLAPNGVKTSMSRRIINIKLSLRHPLSVQDL